MRKTLLAALGVSTTMVVCADPVEIVVPKGGSASVNAACTASAFEVHGTLDVTGSRKTEVAEITLGSDQKLQATVGATTDDDAKVVIGDYGRLYGGYLTLGGPGGLGCLEVGGKRKNDATGVEWDGSCAHVAVRGITLSKDATSEAKVIDVLKLNEGAAVGLRSGNRIANASRDSDMRLLFNGGYLGFFNCGAYFPFYAEYNDSAYFTEIPKGYGGKKIILEGQDGHPVDIRFTNHSSDYPYLSQGSKSLVFKGTGDVCISGSGNAQYVPECWMNVDGDTSWQQKGDLVLSGLMRFKCAIHNCLPFGADSGIVRHEGVELSHFDLAGLQEKVNGLVVTGAACLTNSSTKTAELYFGKKKADALLSVKTLRLSGGAIRAVKVNTGTMLVTNTPAWTALDVQRGSMVVRDDCAMGQLDLGAGVPLSVEGGTLTTQRFADGCTTVTSVNGGKLVLGAGGAGDTTMSLNVQGDPGVAQVEKSGAGVLTIASCRQPAVDLRVKAGTVNFARSGTQGQWFRFTFKKVSSGTKFNLTEIYFFDASGAKIDLSWKMTTAAAGTAAGDLKAGQVWVSDRNWSNNVEPHRLFTADGATYGYASAPVAGDDSTWKVLVARLPANTAPVAQYALYKEWDSTGDMPSDWTLETSADGVTWTSGDTCSGETPPTFERSFYRAPYPICTGESAPFGLASAGTVEVDRGATADFTGVENGQEIAHLTLDWSDLGTGDGTLKNVRIAEVGTLSIVNVPENASLRSSTVLPLVFSGVAEAANLQNWTVTVNGVLKNRLKLKIDNGRLAFDSRGFALFVR